MKKKNPKKKDKIYVFKLFDAWFSKKKKKICSMLNYKVDGVKYSSYLVQ